MYCKDNQLTSLDVKNGNNINFLAFYSNGILSHFGFSTLNNPNLSCISVDDSIFSTINWTNIDPQHYFSDSCATNVYGCMDILACNYDSLATIDDGSCYSLTLTTTIANETSLLDDGSITVNASGGIPPYVYYFSNGFTKPSIKPITGLYWVEVTDANGCGQ